MVYKRLTLEFRAAMTASTLLAVVLTSGASAWTQEAQSPVVLRISSNGTSTPRTVTGDPKSSVAATSGSGSSGVQGDSTPNGTVATASAGTDSSGLRKPTSLDRAARVQLISFSRAHSFRNDPRLTSTSPTWRLWINDYTVLRRSGVRQLLPAALSIVSISTSSEIRLAEDIISSRLRAERAIMLEAATLQLQQRGARATASANSFSDLICFSYSLPDSTWYPQHDGDQLTRFRNLSYANFMCSPAASLFVVDGDKDQFAVVTESQRFTNPDMSFLFSAKGGGVPPPPAGGQASPAR